MTTTGWVVVGALAAACTVALALAAVALRRQASLVEGYLRAQDERITERFASFSQLLGDSLSTVLAASRTSGSRSITERSGHESLCRMLEESRERTAADAALALVAPQTGPPIVAMVGMTQDEADEVIRMRLQESNGARAVQVAFNGPAASTEAERSIRSGLAISLLGTPEPASMLGVFVRTSDRQFSEADIEELEDVARRTRAQIEISFGLRSPDVVPQLDPLTQLIDATAFETIVEREILRARLAGEPLTLVVADVDRLTTINAQVGMRAGDRVIAETGRRLHDVVGRAGYVARLLGGRFAVLLPGADAGKADELFALVRSALADRPVEPVGTVSMSAGVAEHVPADDVVSLVQRAEIALRAAKERGKGSIERVARAA